MPSKESSHICAQCKGSRRLCGRPRCPILERLQTQLELEKEIQGNDLFGASPPSVLVGEFNYPRIRIGPMIPPVIDDKVARLHDNPPEWYGRSIEDIIGLRSRLIRSNFSVNVKEASHGRRTVQFGEFPYEAAPLLLINLQQRQHETPDELGAWAFSSATLVIAYNRG